MVTQSDEEEGDRVDLSSASDAHGAPEFTSIAQVDISSSSSYSSSSDNSSRPTDDTCNKVADTLAPSSGVSLEPSDVDEVEDDKATNSTKRNPICRLLRHPTAVIFYGLSYVPFCISLLFHSVLSTSRPVDPAHWDVTHSDNRKYWYIAVGLFLFLTAYSASTVGWISNETMLGPYIWPVLGSSLALHLLTIRYVHLRPELCRLGADDCNIRRTFKKSNWRNWFGVVFALVEFAQMLAIPFGGSVPWIPSNEDGGDGASDSKFTRTIQDILRTFLVVSNNETANLIFSSIIVGLFAILIGEFISSRRCTDDRLGPLLYRLLPGGLFLTTVASMLRVGKVAVLPERKVAVLIGMLLYTTPSVFVSVYRADLRVDLSDVRYAPMFLCRERVVKEIFAVVAVYILSPDSAIGLLVAVTVLGLAMLWVLCDSVQYSCLTIVNLRRYFVSFSVWSSLSGLVVVCGHGTAGRVLLAVGQLCLLLFSICWALWRRSKKSERGNENEEEEEEEEEEERRQSNPMASLQEDLIAVPF